ncbi:GAF domain-containing protein [Hymenobacter sp. 5516J-16]|uniref:GAF domain-containing protein n=1 Tax=Hymenobacter sublimis TaxID=2933777 RepID=A0ABY4J6S3_9BACT|nr:MULTISPECIES: GAF domain-containing protein [Hymenobacter]UOQ77530.1 GAF domain-containing protein [Hymenobacter sp. 5516J-16]UPL47507.1 GAF domain-containing protein [Hymenobacter sublimis]
MTNIFPDRLVPENETARLRTLHLYQIVNTTPEKIFDDYVAWAAQLFNTPISLISFVDDDYVHFKAVTGAEGVPGLPRTESMCSAAILPDMPVVTTDYSAEGCRLISPDVAQTLGLNFYAGSALRMPDGARIGMMAVIGREHRTLSGAEEEVLTRLAHLVSQTVELRFQYLQAQQDDLWQEAQQELAETLDDNATLTRYLSTRNHGINLDDTEVQDLVLRRLTGVEKVLDRRLREAPTAA